MKGPCTSFQCFAAAFSHLMAFHLTSPHLTSPHLAPDQDVRALGRGVTYYYRFQLPARTPGGPTPTRALARTLVYNEGFDVVKVRLRFQAKTGRVICCHNPPSIILPCC